MGSVCGVGEAQVAKRGNDKTAKEDCAKEADDFNKAIKEHQGGADAGAVATKKTVSSATRLVTHTDAQLRELAKWPAQAHAEWNKLTQPERIAVFENMSKLHGGDFAKKFLEFTKSGSRQDGAYYGPHFPEHTPQWFAERGFKLAQRDSVHDWWVHPSGYSITANRDGSPWKPGTYDPKPTPPKIDVPPPKCEPGDSTELMKMTAESIKQNTSENEDRQKEATELKEKMDKMNVTSPEFKKAYDDYGAKLDEGKKRVEAQIEELEAAEEALKGMCASTSNIEKARNDLQEQLTWFEVTRGLHDMDIRKPIKADVK